MENLHVPGWYIVHTRPFWEKKVTELFSRKKVEHYCPIKKVKRQEFRHIEILHEPLFPSFVFVYCTPGELSHIKMMHGVTNLVHWLQKPAIVRNEEIDIIKNFLSLYPETLLEKTTMCINSTGPAISGQELKQNGMNYFVQQQLPSLGYALKARVSQQISTSTDSLQPEDFQQSRVTEFAL